MRPLEKIKEGILNRDLVLIAEGYSDMTGEEVESPESPPTGDQFLDHIDKKLDVILSILSTISSVNCADLEVQEEVKSPKTVTKKKTTKKKSVETEDLDVIKAVTSVNYCPPLVSGPVNANKDKMIFPTSGLINEDEQAINQKMSKSVQKDKRSAPKSHIKCSICSKDIFNPSRMIKGRTVDQNTSTVVCPHCKGEFSWKG